MSFTSGNGDVLFRLSTFHLRAALMADEKYMVCLLYKRNTDRQN